MAHKYESFSKNEENHLPNICRYMNEEVIINLIESGADTNFCDGVGNTCLHYFARLKSPSILNTTLHSGSDNINTLNVYRQSALMLACKRGNVDLVKLLIQRGADLTLFDESENTCLHYAVDSNSEETLHFLLSMDILNINSKDVFGETPLLRACRKGKSESVKVLLEMGADVNATTRWGSTCLHSATGLQTVDVLKCLLHCKNINVNAGNCHRQTALMVAFRDLNEEAANLLLSNGAILSSNNPFSK